MSAAPAVSDLPQEVRNTARLWNFDAYLAATLAPVAQQSDLISLAAFVGELERIAQTVSEPTLAQIRVQWWRDELQRVMRGELSDHPIGLALVDSVKRNAWPPGLLVGIADAVADQLSTPDLGDEQIRNAWLGKRYGAAFDLATRFQDTVLAMELIEVAGRAYGLSMLANRLQVGEDFGSEVGLSASPQDLRAESVVVLERAIPLLRILPRGARAGLLPLSLVRAYAGAKGGQPGALAKVMRYAAAHWMTRF